MKLDLTVEELQNLTNVERVTALEQENHNLEQENHNLHHDKWELIAKFQEQGVLSNSGGIAEVMIAVVRYYTQTTPSTADTLRKTLGALVEHKILQLKILRQVSGAGLKEVKDFLDGESDYLPSPAENLDLPF